MNRCSKLLRFVYEIPNAFIGRILQAELTVREIAKTVYIRSCDMIGRGKTKTNHIGREGLKRVKFL